MQFLKQPYPFFHSGRELIRNSILLFTIGFIFLYLLEPFNVYHPEHRFSYAVICLIHGGSAALILFVYSLLVRPWINEDNWKIYKELIFLFFALLLIGIGSFLWREVIYDNPDNVSMRYFLEEIRNSFLVGGLLIFIIVTINFNLLNRNNQKKANIINIKPDPEASPISKVSIETSVAADNFDIDPSQLICAKADGNYVEFFLVSDNGVEKKIARLTLQSALKQLVGIPEIIKTHRAFLVNLKYVKKVKGNAQGYLISLSHIDFLVPVSRGNLKTFDLKMV